LQYKAALVMIIFGVLIVFLLSLGFDIYSYRIVYDKEINNIENISKEVSLHIESHLIEKSIVATTLSSAPIIKETVMKSNARFSVISKNNRKRMIENLNKKWMKTSNVNDPFIRDYMSNTVAQFLKYQQKIIPGEYGEIFLTNRYGVMIATTGKLTTLAHRHKYWWQASFNDGKGRIFIDDRGFDASVKGYVLGIVVPIKHNNKIIGILKSNVNIMGPLTDIVQEFGGRHPCKMRIVRTGGLIVAEKGVAPLSQKVSKAVIKKLQKKDYGNIIAEENNIKYLMAYSPIKITLGSSSHGFGGKKESLGHIKGNKGEAWHVVVCYKEKDFLKSTHEVTKKIIFAGIIFTILSAAVAQFFGKWIARPIINLSQAAHKIGEGDLATRVKVTTSDEIGVLGNSVNEMVENLQISTTSIDKLLSEIKERKRLEDQLRYLTVTDELTGAYNRRAFNEYLEKNISRAKRYNEPLSFLLLDIDHFKNINDSHGHDVGDEVLKIMVDMIKNSIRSEDIFARWGGEEFVLLLPQTNSDSAIVLAERLRTEIAQYNFSNVGTITVSIGISELNDGDGLDELIKRGDMALYNAKESGRNNVKIF